MFPVRDRRVRIPTSLCRPRADGAVSTRCASDKGHQSGSDYELHQIADDSGIRRRSCDGTHGFTGAGRSSSSRARSTRTG